MIQFQNAIAQDKNLHSAGPDGEHAVSAKILNALGCLVLILDTAGRIIRLNAACEKLIGLSTEEVYNRFLWDLGSLPRDQAVALNTFFQAASFSSPEGSELPGFDMLAHDGSRRNVAWNTTILFDESNQPVRILYAGTDISDLRRTQAATSQARAVAESASRAKSEFLAHISHEIRTPMTAILGHIDLLDETGPSTDPLSIHECRQSLRAVRRNAEHLLQLINDILDLSKIEAGKLKVESIPCCPMRVVNDVASVMRLRAVEKKIAFQVQYIGPVPQTITTDPTRLRQVLINLLSNALKFTHTGSVRLLVRLLNHNSFDRPQLQFQVVDTGIGMTQEQITTLFRPFTQAAPSTARIFGGTGLGLSICKQLAEAMGGGISVDSISGAGTTFTAWINPGNLQGVPLIVDTGEGDAAFPARTRISRELTLDQSLGGARILLAEDGPDNQYLISLLLRRAGAKVTVADNGRTAFALALDSAREGQQFDLIIMDMQMPEMDGYTATRRLRERAYTGKIIALTAHTMPGDRERCLSEGCDDYIPKPFEPVGFIQAVTETVQRTMNGQTPLFAPAPARASEFASRDVLMQDPEYVALLEQYCRVLHERAAELQTALTAGDLTLIHRHATDLKGSAGGFGFSHITAAASLVERAMSAQLPLGQLRRAIEELVNCCQKSTPAQPPNRPLSPFP